MAVTAALGAGPITFFQNDPNTGVKQFTIPLTALSFQNGTPSCKCRRPRP